MSGYSDNAATHDEVAAALGISRQRAYQIEQQALRKFRLRLQARLAREGLTLQDLLEVAQVKADAVGSMMALLESSHE